MTVISRKMLVMVIALVMMTSLSVLGEDLRLKNYFTDNMVLQRDKPLVIQGAGNKGAKVTVTFAGQTKLANVGDDGKWSVTLDPIPANAKGQKLTVASSIGNQTVSAGNIVVGDVIMFARQTYVDISLGRTEAGRAAAKAFKPSPAFRAVHITTVPAQQPQDELGKDMTSGWMTVDSKTAPKMSAAAFYLGKDLVEELGVPVGIIDVDMGHHFGIGWLSEKGVADAAVMHPNDQELDWLPKWMREKAEERDSGKAQKDLDAYYEQASKKHKFPKPSLGLHPLEMPMFPSAGYNAVINPLKHIALKGILLQLGNDYPFIAYRELEKRGVSTEKVELDAAWGDNYMILKSGYRVTPVTLPYVPEDWRNAFGDKSLPIGLVLPPASDLDVYAAHNREMREMHRRTANNSEGIGLILPGMENIPSSGQPADDALLAERCKQWVLSAVAGKDVAPTGPVFDRMEAKLGKATLYFKEGTADGLKATGEALAMFETAGPDRKFRPAKASLDGATIKLRSEGPIEFVRYNWTYEPDQGLVNSAGLPALPFNTDADWKFSWIPPPEVEDLPPEYSTTADKWENGDVAIINGQLTNLAGGDSQPIPMKPGPLGIAAVPFGPNIYVKGTDPGSPADGKLLPGDLIYGVNGRVFDDGPDVANDAQYFVLADAITYSESEEGGGRMVLSVRRGSELLDVTLQLEVLGSYSSTTPYYCEKSENIVKNAEAWISARYRPEQGPVWEPVGMLNTNLLFLLASGTPEHQGLVRRAVYAMMAKMEPKPVTRGMRSKPWNTGYASLALGEYFHATGDRNVLPYLKFQADLSAESQIKPKSETPPTKEAAQSEEQVGGWRQNYPGIPDRWKSGYGLMPHAGMSCVMGMQLAKEAGLEIDEVALERGLEHFYKQRAEYGFVVYAYANVRRDGPPPVNPKAEANGMLWSMNGKLGTAAALYNMVGYNTAVDICSRHCVYGYNKTRSGHGGMFFNNFWTPVGAWAGGESGFRHFMKGQTWWRELFRRHDGSFNQAGRGGVGVSYGLPYVAPKQRLRILDAPRSAFGTNCPDYLKPALEAHKQRDYAKCEALILKQMESALPAEEMPVVNHLLESVQTLRASIEHDLSLCEKLIEDGKHYYASEELPQLRGVVAEDNKRLQAIVAALESKEGKARVDAHRKAIYTEKEKLDAERKAAAQPQKKEQWISLTPATGGEWQMKVVEDIDQAPEGWTGPKFDDSSWDTAHVPISWTMYHTALFRGTFNIEDKSVVDGVRLMGRFFQQQNVVVYLNGKLVAKIDQLDRGGKTTEARLTDYAMKLLKEGENTIAISSRHKRRWGSYRGTYKTAAGVGFWVEARKAE